MFLYHANRLSMWHVRVTNAINSSCNITVQTFKDVLTTEEEVARLRNASYVSLCIRICIIS